MKNTVASVEYIVTVTGRTWGGFEACMEYNFDHIPTDIEVKQKAGDFDAYKVIDMVKCTSIYEFEDMTFTTSL